MSASEGCVGALVVLVAEADWTVGQRIKTRRRKGLSE